MTSNILSGSFNSRKAADAELAQRLQDIVYAAPEKLDALRAENPEKDILLALVPFREGNQPTQMAVIDAFATTMEQTMGLDTRISGIVSAQYGRFLFVAVKPKEGEDAAPNDGLKPEERRALEAAEIGSVGIQFMGALAQGKDPNAIPYPRMEYASGEPVPSFFEGRVHYWEVSKDWEKPALKGTPVTTMTVTLPRPGVK